jgi:hypothetical protein
LRCGLTGEHACGDGGALDGFGVARSGSLHNQLVAQKSAGVHMAATAPTLRAPPPHWPDAAAPAAVASATALRPRGRQGAEGHGTFQLSSAPRRRSRVRLVTAIRDASLSLRRHGCAKGSGAPCWVGWPVGSSG